jgi:hypothetical protein
VLTDCEAEQDLADKYLLDDGSKTYQKMMKIIGFCEAISALALVTPLRTIGLLVLAINMSGAVYTHIQIGDSPVRSLYRVRPLSLRLQLRRRLHPRPYLKSLAIRHRDMTGAPYRWDLWPVADRCPLPCSSAW